MTHIYYPVKTVSDDLVKRLDNLWAMLEEEGFYTKAATVTLARNRIEEMEAKLAAREKLVLALAGDKIDLVSELADVKGKLAKAMEGQDNE